jgi:hypothetical protein
MYVHILMIAFSIETFLFPKKTNNKKQQNYRQQQ